MAARSHRGHEEITLLQERSAGTFARVYLAEAHSHDGLKRIVAVKILKAQWSDEPDLINRTRDEARLLARLHHRNILRVEGLAEYGGQPAIIMEFVDGLDLGQLIKKLGRPLPPRAALHIARDAAGALEAAYFRTPYGSSNPLNVIHRDIKPSNIMLSVEGEVKVLDFGTAHYQNEIRLAQTGALRLGSLKYMSPERRSGDRGDHSCDIYALGLVLLEMLLGETLPVIPIEAREHDRLIASYINQIPLLGMPNDEWEASFQEALSRMCAHKPSLRLDASQLLQLLRTFSDQASGESLETFASGPVHQLARELYGDGTTGAMTGNRMLVALSESGSMESLAQAAPVAVPGAQEPHEVAQAKTPSPTPQTPPSPPVHPAAENKNTALYAAVGLIFLGGFGLALVMAVVLGVYLLRAPEPASISPVSQPAPAVENEGTRLQLTAADETIQWIRLKSSDQSVVLKADPQNSASLSPGTYQLYAKVIGYPSVSAEFTLEEETSLSCTPASSGKVRCSDPAQDLQLALF
jgi:serine/threonine protein kinase